jgi:hypothetical protein
MHTCKNCLKPLLDENTEPILDKRIKYCKICGPIIAKQKSLAYARLYYKQHKQRCFNCLKILRNLRHLLHDKRIKYCHFCAPIVEKRKKLAREQRFRDKHKKELQKISRRWRRKHRVESRLIQRNYAYRHPEKCNQSLKDWRKKNPDKVSLQNKRAKRNIRRREVRNLREKGIYIEIKWSIKCPECKQEFKTSAKRPQCNCGYIFPRDYMEKFIDKLKTTPCKCCEREIPYQMDVDAEGQHRAGRRRKYCECCFPQIQALKKIFAQIRWEKKHPKTNTNKKSYRNNTEIVVAVTCIFCDEIILGHSGKRICPDCYLKWSRKIPQKIQEILASWSSFKFLPRDLLAWRRIMYYRDGGIYSLR